MRKKQKIIIFDLDETIGYFQDLSSLFVNEIKRFPNSEPRNILFGLMDLNPVIFRENIFDIFHLIINAKKKNQSLITILFTNNQGPKLWYNLIIEYIHYKLNYPLFDYVIGPYKIGDVVIEPYRTSHNKDINDLSNIIGIPIENMDIIIFEDQLHTNMVHKNVIYVKLEPYVHYIEPNKKYIDDYNLMRENMLHFLYYK
tara:strand:+ start:6496 stop:7092 length:597 start_codon:yes stop_codon:yes gene_type:complete